MKYVLATAFVLAAGAAYAQDVDNRGVDDGTTLGEVTQDAVTAPGGGQLQGAHASDPGNDGLGTGADQPRSGLANAVADHDLSETIDLIDGD